MVFATLGEEASINSLRGVPQRMISLKIDLNNNQLFNNLISGLGVTLQGWDLSGHMLEIG